jgi:SAM-dependent methyltransferase
MNISEKFHRYVDENGLYSKRGYSSLNHRCRQIFDHVCGLDGKTMLEIGSGEGLFSLWALANGIERAVLLEPEADGATKGVAGKLLKHQKALNIPDERLRLYTQTFQEYKGEKESFDIILSYASINHLDEPACINLHKSEKAYSTYKKYFEKIYNLMRPGGHFILSDAGRINLWNQIGMNSPFSPSIEWEKHQGHALWRQILSDTGFSFVSSDWLRFYPLRKLGFVGCNRLVAWATISQFIITVVKD